MTLHTLRAVPQVQGHYPTLAPAHDGSGLVHLSHQPQQLKLASGSRVYNRQCQLLLQAPPS